MRSVKPRQTKGRPGWLATFSRADGSRVTRGLGTRVEAEAQLICAALSALAAGECTSPDDAAPSTPRKALELFFGDAIPPLPDGADVESDLVIGDEPPDVSGLPPAVARQLLRYHLVAQRAQVERDAWRARYEQLACQHEALQASALARAAQAAATCPPLEEALADFGRHMRAAATRKHARETERIARAFAETLPPGARTPAHITPEQVSSWLDEDAAASSSPVSRRAKRRILLGRFINWAADVYGFVSPMGRVKTATVQQLERERGGIDWHELAEVEAALEPLNPYWRALVGTLAFAGLRLAELAWLRVEDLQEAGARRQLWITSVDDGHGERHDLKTGRSQRAVDVHPARLWPLLKAHLAAGGAGELFLFPMPAEVKRRTRGAGHPERWRPDTLSGWLNGRHAVRVVDGEQLRVWVPGKIPPGMTAQSLRRTFGSLLMRSGRSVEQVAAAMGNSPTVVQRHYARILGAEVSVDF